MNSEFWSSFFSSYIKRWLEGKYDALRDIPAVAKLQAINPNAKLGIEAILYAITAYLGQRVQPQSTVAMVMKEVLKDAAPEICARLLKDARHDLLTVTNNAGTDAAAKSVATHILAMEDAEILSLLLMLEGADADKIERFRHFASAASHEDLKKLAALPLEQRWALIGLDALPSGPGAGVFLRGFWEVLKNRGKAAGAVSRTALSAYVRGLLWLLKCCAILWACAFLVWTVFSLSAGDIALGVGLGVLVAACGGAAWMGRKHALSWLMWGATLAGACLLLLLLMAVSGRGDLIPGLSFLLLLGLPSLTLVACLAPLTTVLELLHRTLPSVYDALVSSLRLVVVAFFGILFLTLLFMVFPVRSNPGAIFILGPLAILVIAAVGIGITRVSPERFLGWPFKVGLVVIVMVSLFGLSMPDITARLGALPDAINESVVSAPQKATFASSREIDFVNSKNGKSRLWYVQNTDGAFDLYRADPRGGFTQDGRKLKLADSVDARQKISAWVDAQAAARQAEAIRKAEELRLDEQQKAEIAKVEAARMAQTRRLEELHRADAAKVEAERSERERLAARRVELLGAGYDGEKLPYLVVAESDKYQSLAPMALATAQAFTTSGRKASGAVLMPAFVESRVADALTRGQTSEDFRMLNLGSIADRVLIAHRDPVVVKATTTVAGFRSTTVTVRFFVIDAANGRVLKQFEVAGTGVGGTDQASYDAALERLINTLVKEKLKEHGL